MGTRSKRPKVPYLVYGKYPDSPWFFKGETWAVSPPQAVNNVFFRLHGRHTLREDVGQTFRALERGSTEDLRMRARAGNVPHSYMVELPPRPPAPVAQDFLFDMGG